METYYGIVSDATERWILQWLHHKKKHFALTHFLFIGKPVLFRILQKHAYICTIEQS